VNPGSLTSLNQAIDTIIGEVKAKTANDQRLVDGQITAFETATGLPVSDTALDTAQTTTCARVEPAETALTATQTKSYQLDFGAAADTAQLAANNAKVEVDTDLQAFEGKLRDLNAKTLACSDATTAATAAAGDLVAAKDRAYCQAKVSYDDVVTDVTANSATQITNIKHFKMLKCVMTEYAAHTKEKAALDKCSAQTYDVDVVTVNLKASQAVVPASTVCVATAPTAPPTNAAVIPHNNHPCPAGFSADDFDQHGSGYFRALNTHDTAVPARGDRGMWMVPPGDYFEDMPDFTIDLFNPMFKSRTDYANPANIPTFEEMAAFCRNNPECQGFSMSNYGTLAVTFKSVVSLGKPTFQMYPTDPNQNMAGWCSLTKKSIPTA